MIRLNVIVPERGIEYRRHRFFFNSERFAGRSHPGEDAPAWQKIGRMKPVLAGGGRDIALPRELVKQIRLKWAF
jgi:hypothetical protein